MVEFDYLHDQVINWPGVQVVSIICPLSNIKRDVNSEHVNTYCSMLLKQAYHIHDKYKQMG